MEHKRHQTLRQKSQYLSNRQFIFTFGFARSSEGVERAFVDMEYVASDELGNLVRLGIFREMHFTYAVQLVRKIITIPLNMSSSPPMMYIRAGPG